MAAEPTVAEALQLEPPLPPAALASGAELQTVVVGAGPAGLLAACLLAQAGVSVAVVDARERPTEFYGSFPVVRFKVHFKRSIYVYFRVKTDFFFDRY